MLFASLVLERMPLHWSVLPGAMIVWLQNVGAVAAFGLALVLLARRLQRDPNELNFWTLPRSWDPLQTAVKFAIWASFVGYAIIVIAWIALRLNVRGAVYLVPMSRSANFITTGDLFLAACGLLALFAVLTPPIYDCCTRIRCGRIWAMAILSWKEAVRGRVVWVFGAMALVFLFAEWFLPYKPEDQIRNYVHVTYLSMTILFLITAGLLGSFSIPNDVKNNSIHTIVTKPVEKFEVVLGRFLGYAGLLTIGLFLVSLLSLVYIVRGVNEESAKESYKARVPIYGHLRFAGTKKEEEADSVGREWSYRTYITGPTYTRREPLRQFAVWDFYEVPADVLNQEEDIVFEFGFDIFRLSKGIETAKGVNCTFTFVNARDSTFFTSDNISAQGQHLDRHMTELIQAKPKEVLKTHRMVMVKAVPVTDYHTQSDVSIPADAFREMMGDGKPRVEADGTAVPALRVFVSVDVATEAQMVGVARGDFYLLSGVRDFWQNFLKGVVGMWCTHMLVLGVAVACSTYLSSVISLLGTMFLFVAGLFGDYLRDIAEGRVEGGGPLEAGLRLGTRTPLAKPFEASPTMSLVQSIDTAFSWWVGRIMNLIPDVTRHDLHPYVANGFDIGWFDVILLDNFLPLIGYLAPWAIAAYYLMKYREIANPQ